MEARYATDHLETKSIAMPARGRTQPGLTPRTLKIVLMPITVL